VSILCHDRDDFTQFLVFNRPKSCDEFLMAIPIFPSWTSGWCGLKAHVPSGMVGDKGIRHDVNWQQRGFELEAVALAAGDERS
jgi:hypothetical protein